MKSRMTTYQWTGPSPSPLRTSPLSSSFYKAGVPGITEVVIGSKINKFEIIQYLVNTQGLSGRQAEQAISDLEVDLMNSAG